MTTKPRAAPPRQPPERSGRAPLKLVTPYRALGDADPVGREAPQPRAAGSPGLNWGIEPFVDIARELPPLFTKHWEESDDGQRLPLEPDWDLLFDMAMLNRLHIMTVRWSKPLVGYIMNLTLPSILSKSTLQGQIHTYYLHPSYRDEPGFLMRWFRANDEFLVNLGCKKIYATVSNSHRGGKMGIVFKRLGYELSETQYARML